MEGDVPPSRALEEKKGDQQSRAELLGELLNAAGERPFIVTHGSEENVYHVILVGATDEEIRAVKVRTLAVPMAVSVSKLKFIALPLEKDAKAGQIDKRYYDPDKSAWTVTVSVFRYR